jgi:hypothetical protein
MQPYFFPYLGYWQLLNYVDRFVIYDDVNYIKGGWINRNRILINGEPRYLTIPLRDASPNKLIYELAIAESVGWRNKLLKSVEGAYKKSPFFEEAIPVIQEIIQFNDGNLASFLSHQIIKLVEFLGIQTEVRETSRNYNNGELAGQTRVIDICRRENAKRYLNAEGGMALYDRSAFGEAGLTLQFIKMNSQEYVQRASAFVPNLSIVDVLMAVGREGVRDLLADYSLIE